MLIHNKCYKTNLHASISFHQVPQFCSLTKMKDVPPYNWILLKLTSPANRGSFSIRGCTPLASKYNSPGRQSPAFADYLQKNATKLFYFKLSLLLSLGKFSNFFSSKCYATFDIPTTFLESLPAWVKLYLTCSLQILMSINVVVISMQNKFSLHAVQTLHSAMSSLNTFS